MSGQSNAAAERSAHVERSPAKKPGADFLAEVRPGVWQLKALAEAEREVERLRAALQTAADALQEAGCTYGWAAAHAALLTEDGR